MGIIIWSAAGRHCKGAGGLLRYANEVLCFQVFVSKCLFRRKERNASAFAFRTSSFFFFLSLLFDLSVCVCSQREHQKHDIDQHEVREVLVGSAWFVSDALCVRRDGGGGGWRRRVQGARAHH